VLTNDDELAERIDAVAYPGLTANSDVGRIAAMALSLLDWFEHGTSYATGMVATAIALAEALRHHDVPARHTSSHQFAVEAERWGGGVAMSLRLRTANLLTSAIGLPHASADAAIRLGTPEIVRRGMTAADMPELAALVHRALTDDPTTVTGDVIAFRSRFTGLHYVR
jgi:glycine hydroxymethyltransferase